MRKFLITSFLCVTRVPLGATLVHKRIVSSQFYRCICTRYLSARCIRNLKVAIPFIALFFQGCAILDSERDTVSNSCLFDLSEKTKVNEIPDTIESKYRDDLPGWFKEPNGDYFYCIDRINVNTCGNRFEIHWYVNDIDYEYKGEEIFCIR